MPVKETMNIYSAPGTKVLFTGKNGFPLDKQKALKHLVVEESYTVQRLEVGRFSSVVFLDEIRGLSFNSVHFENIGEYDTVDVDVYNTYFYNRK